MKQKCIDYFGNEEEVERLSDKYKMSYNELIENFDAIEKTEEN